MITETGLIVLRAAHVVIGTSGFHSKALVGIVAASLQRLSIVRHPEAELQLSGITFDHSIVTTEFVAHSQLQLRQLSQ